MASFPGKGDLRSAPYSRLYANPSAVNLTTEVNQAQNACSGLILIATGTAALTYKDCAGVSVALTAIASGTILYLDGVAAIELTSSTAMTVLVYWHPSTAR